MKYLLKKLISLIFSRSDPNKLANYFYSIISIVSISRRPRDSLIFLLCLEQKLLSLTGMESCRYGDGHHTKHKHTKYHEFFTDRIDKNENILDIGCGSGALSFDMARTGANVTGIELSEDNYQLARKRYSLDNLIFIHGDVLSDLPSTGIDTIVMSNVLEHLPNRTQLLKRIQSILQPRRWLIRVPMYQRDWRVPLMKELGVDYRLDSTHQIEYSKEEFEKELYDAELEIISMDFRWGEIWCEASPIKSTK